ncbi:putative transporter [Escherichia coli]|uniref:Putative transporter n=1 Tax=Escherichia coli TaxID=562 RepID=A0A376LH18_ECOLX|nr:putative transporter [Escherichia coli]
MTQQGDAVAGELATEKVGIKGYLAFFLTIIFFSGVFSGTDSWWRVFDFFRSERIVWATAWCERSHHLVSRRGWRGG